MDTIRCRIGKQSYQQDCSQQRKIFDDSVFSVTGIKYNVGSSAFFTRFVARFKTVQRIISTRYWRQLKPGASKLKFYLGGITVVFLGKFLPPQRNPSGIQSRFRPLQPNWTNFPTHMFQNLCTKNDSPRNSRQHIFANVVRGHRQGLEREGFRASIDRRLTCLFLTANQ